MRNTIDYCCTVGKLQSISVTHIITHSNVWIASLMALNSWILVSFQAAMNAILMHHLDLYEENSVDSTFEGLRTLTHFNYFLWHWFNMILHPFRARFNCVNTESVTKIITVITDNCLKLMKMLNNETDIIPCKKIG